MKRIQKYYRKAVPVLAALMVVVLAAVVFRAISIARNAGTEGIKVPAGTVLQYIWLELRAIFKFSRY
jgi:hypothetical protein